MKLNVNLNFAAVRVCCQECGKDDHPEHLSCKYFPFPFCWAGMAASGLVQEYSRALGVAGVRCLMAGRREVPVVTSWRVFFKDRYFTKVK